MSGELVRGGGGKPAVDDNNTGWSTSVLLITASLRQKTLTSCFVGDGGYWIAFEVWPARQSGWHLLLFMNFITLAMGVIITADPILSTWIGHDPISVE